MPDFNIAYALQSDRVRYKCKDCGWELRTNPVRKPRFCGICGGSNIEEIT